MSDGAAKVVLSYEQIAEAIRDYVEAKKLAPDWAESMVVSVKAERGWFSAAASFTAEVRFER